MLEPMSLGAWLGLMMVPPADAASARPGDDASRAGDAVVVRLEPAPADMRLRWSPKGARVELEAAPDGSLRGVLALKPLETPGVLLELRRSSSDGPIDRLVLDLDRDGSLADETVLSCTPREQRGKIWSSFSTEVPIPVVDPWNEVETVPYRINLWHVYDPLEPAAAPLLRWTRRGFFTGTCTLEGVEAFVMVCERTMDGVIDRADSWALATASEPDLALGTTSRSAGEHAWLGERAYRIAAIDPSGLLAVLLPHDPGITRAEEAEQRDRLAADRRAPRSGRSVTFSHDFVEAEKFARAEDRLLLIDFETVWCGPCKDMDRWVYTADEVVDAAQGVVAVKVDGDEARDLVERFGVRGYPTIIMLDAEGVELRRRVGYMSVKDTAAFLRGAGEPRAP